MSLERGKRYNVGLLAPIDNISNHTDVTLDSVISYRAAMRYRNVSTLYAELSTQSSAIPDDLDPETREYYVFVGANEYVIPDYAIAGEPILTQATELSVTVQVDSPMEADKIITFLKDMGYEYTVNQ